MRLYKRIDVWAQSGDESLVCFHCFEVIPDGKYCVQSKDFVAASSAADALLTREQNFLLLFAEMPPEERNPLYDTLEEAIRAYEPVVM
jgi:hypothetical protein